MALIGIVSVFASLAIVAATCIALKRLFKEEPTEKPETTETMQAEKMAVEEEVGTFKIRIDGEEHEVKVEEVGTAGKHFGEETKLGLKKEEYTVKMEEAKNEVKPIREVGEEAPYVVRAPIQGNVIKVPVKVGDRVEKGKVILVLETMKMENAIESPVSGIVKAVNVVEGDSVQAYDILMTIS